jgi:hypothetical protein
VDPVIAKALTGVGTLRTASRVVTQPSMRRTPSPLSLLALCLGGALLVLGCKQSANERCEVSDDCQAGLTCQGAEKGEGICKGLGGDAAVPVADAAGALDQVRLDVTTGADATAVTDGATLDGATDAADGAAADAPANLDSSSN